MVRLFLDTEFTDLLHCELLSIGIVSDDGIEFYAERNDVDLDLCGDFARVAVMPQLGADAVAACSEQDLSQRLVRWLEQFRSRSPVVVSVDHPTDWELFVYLVRDQETLLTPPWIKGQSIRTLIDPLLSEAYWQATAEQRHHALHDARANRHAFRPPVECG